MSVVLVVTVDWKLQGLLNFGAQLAVARKEDLHVLLLFGQKVGKESFVELSREHVTRDFKELTLPEVTSGKDEEEEAGEADFSIHFHQHSGRPRSEHVLQYVSELSPSILVLGKHVEAQNDPSCLSNISRELFVRAPWLSIIIRQGASGELKFRKILVPASGGPHAVEALKIASEIAGSSEQEVVVTGLFVEPEAGELASDVGEEILGKALRRAGLEGESFVEQKVVLANNVFKGIAQELESGEYDLLLLGASNTGVVRRALFGTIPDRLMSGDHSLALAVVRARTPIARRIKTFLENWLDLTVPQLEREERIMLFQTLQSGSRWGFDFMALITLSTLLAAIGLIQNSTAVVIGAMLVAPLMMPLIGAGLALVQGNAPLMRDAARAIAYGFLVALIAAWLLGITIPEVALTEEMRARGGPTLLDMAVGFLSGLAAAHCLARPGLSAALPGVAIAAALVPPIATVGISVAVGAIPNARGAALLFSTNVIAIILGASFCLYAAGLREKERESAAPVWVYGVTLGLLLSAAVLTVPLGLVVITDVASSGVARVERPESKVASLVGPFIRKKAGRRLENVTVFKGAKGRQVVEIEYIAATPPGKKFAKRINNLLKPHFQTPTRLRLIPKIIMETEISGQQ